MFAEKETGYLTSWERAHRCSVEPEEHDHFYEYRTHVEKFSMLMELLFDLKDEPG